MISKDVVLTDLNKGYKTPLDYLEQIIKQEKIICVHAVIYSSGKKNLNRLVEITKNTELCVIISGYMKRMQESSYNFIKNNCSNVLIINTHCKLILVRTNKYFYVINSTSNLNSNSKYEFTEIHNSKKYYNLVLEIFKNH
jgi:hypothetical protein